MDGHRVVDVFVVVRYAVTRDLDSRTPVDGLRQTARWPTQTWGANPRGRLGPDTTIGRCLAVGMEIEVTLSRPREAEG